ncbi:MFS transporter [Caldimonas thermodepolymerans]|jgi:Arabinose efflux permease|uniref:MFS family arabinose efflux permease n=1 Tax=Caldimonas thermodepolymerans TaxID=215580 RepID=A0A2S5T709_9BURK|nr:MFS transporter [Caldimonas thermodepolymerans]PPE70770.1 MFS transporter [Caldimonas thermodepolymerans]QPC32985.1 MFS transporter [Caldimonas thermodepolymerans]RDI03769.1 putative MFS family arabinose efflux permease [Caldimonas thermodepolymerans]TCP09736.1 putative MFS family arabinose efflux permease [Caldimonas thermodepolymerans]UZG45853.1 MFS transporter [Caldimonas thermodepolymerans]
MISRPLVALIGGQVCLHACMAGTRMAAPLLALNQGHSTWAVGILLALFGLGPACVALSAGRLADRHGYHRPVAIGVAMVVSGALLALVFQHYLALCVAAVLTGGGTTLGGLSIQRTAGRSASDPTQLKRIFSWLALGPAFSNFFGPLAAGVLIDAAGFRAAFAFLALLPLLTLWWARQVPREPVTPAAGGRRSTLSALDLLRHAPLRRLLVVNWTMSTCWDVHAFVVPILGHERALSASAIGSILGAFAVASVGVRLLIPLVAHRVKEWQVLLGAMAASALVFALYPLSVDAWTMGLCSVLLGTSLGAVQPMVMATLHQVTPHDRQGQALGLRSLTIHASASVMPMLFGAAGAAIGAAPLFWAATALIGVGASRIGGLRRDLEAPSLSPAAPDAAPRG